MKDCKIYSSMILSILSSSKDKKLALLAINQNFIFKGTLRMDTEALFIKHHDNQKILVAAFIKLIEQFSKNKYPYLGSICLNPTRERLSSHSS